MYVIFHTMGTGFIAPEKYSINLLVRVQNNVNTIDAKAVSSSLTSVLSLVV